MSDLIRFPHPAGAASLAELNRAQRVPFTQMERALAGFALIAALLPVVAFPSPGSFVGVLAWIALPCVMWRVTWAMLTVAFGPVR